MPLTPKSFLTRLNKLSLEPAIDLDGDLTPLSSLRKYTGVMFRGDHTTLESYDFPYDHFGSRTVVITDSLGEPITYFQDPATGEYMTEKFVHSAKKRQLFAISNGGDPEYDRHVITFDPSSKALTIGCETGSVQTWRDRLTDPAYDDEDWFVWRAFRQHPLASTLVAWCEQQMTTLKPVKKAAKKSTKKTSKTAAKTTAKKTVNKYKNPKKTTRRR